MARTAIGLFRDNHAADIVMRELENAGFARERVRVLTGSTPSPSGLERPGNMAGNAPQTGAGIGSTSWLKIEGVPNEDFELYRRGLDRGSIVVAVTTTDERADYAAEIMNRCGALDVEERTSAAGRGMSPPSGEGTVQAGRNRYEGGGARVFVW